MADPFRTILLATQGTEFDAGAERLALDLAARCGLPLHAVLPLVSNPEYQSIAPLQEDAWEAQAAASLATLRRSAAAHGVQLHGTVRRGEDPAHEIVAQARDLGADLIVLRRRGKRGFLAKLLMGEMVQAVTTHAPCHVLVVPRAAHPWSQRIVLATDGSPHSAAALDLALSIARQCALPLTLVSVAERGDARAAACIAAAQAAARKAGIEARARILAGAVDRAILQAAEDDGADLIVVGRRGLNALKRIVLGSTSKRVVSHAKVPVLIAHAPD